MSKIKERKEHGFEKSTKGKHQTFYKLITRFKNEKKINTISSEAKNIPGMRKIYNNSPDREIFKDVKQSKCDNQFYQQTQNNLKNENYFIPKSKLQNKTKAFKKANSKYKKRQK